MSGRPTLGEVARGRRGVRPVVVAERMEYRAKQARALADLIDAAAEDQEPWRKIQSFARLLRTLADELDAVERAYSREASYVHGCELCDQKRAAEAHVREQMHRRRIYRDGAAVAKPGSALLAAVEEYESVPAHFHEPAS